MSRWTFYADMNWDGAVTISDVWLWMKWVFFLPGDVVIAVLLNVPTLTTFFEISQASYGNWVSGVISLVFWLPFMLIVAVAVESALE